MKKKILIIGYGSIGQKHLKIIKKVSFNSEILVYSRQKNLKLNSTNNLLNTVEFDPDFIFICSETIEHFTHIKFVEKNFKKKIVLIEKPVFHKVIKKKFNKNLYFVGYNLRFHPVLNYLKKKIKKMKIFSIRVNCSSYLPDWRKRDYTKVYSSVKKRGGGVLLDLSHEIDYVQWLLGKITKIEKTQIKKISKLNINVEDSGIILGKIREIFFNMNINFFSKFNERVIIIDSNDCSIKADLLNFKVDIFSKKKKLTINFKKQNLITYYLQDQHLLSKNFLNLCDLEEGLSVLKIIKKIRNA